MINLLTELRDGTWLDAQVFPPLDWTVKGIVPEGFSLFVGPPKAGKSWAGLGLALACASGGRAFGCIRVRRRPVLYLALEDGHRRLQARCRVLLTTDPIPSDVHFMTRVLPGQILATIEQWLEQHGDAKPLVILDTLGKVMPPSLQGESQYQRDYRIGGRLKGLVDKHPGSSIVVIHHDRKAVTEDFVDSVSGTHGLAGSADTIITLARARHSADGVLSVTGRDVEENEYAVTVSGGRWELMGGSLAAAAAKAPEVRARAGSHGSERTIDIISALAAFGPGGATPAQIAQRLDIDNKTTGTYLGRLSKSGQIVKLERGKYALSDPVESVETAKPKGDDDDQTVFDISTLSTAPTGAVALSDQPCDCCGEPLPDFVIGEGGRTHPNCSPECRDGAA